ncbi:MAG: hypothetical protein QM723_40610 [Myxococcaceae bacterium]
MTAPIRRDVGPLDLRAEIIPTSVDEKSRTFEVTFSTGAKVLRSSFWSSPSYEELSLDPAHVRMDRLKSGAAPFLADHNGYDVSRQPGRVMSARLEGGKGIAKVQMDDAGNDADADRLFGKIKSGVVRNVSIGYRTYKTEDVTPPGSPRGTVPTFRATDWEPFEISMVTIPADAGAGLRSLRDQRSVQTNECVFETRGASMSEVVKGSPEEQLAAERQRVSDINALCTRGNIPAEFKQSLIDGNKSKEEARTLVLDFMAERSDKTAPMPGGARQSEYLGGSRIEMGLDEKTKIMRGMIGAELAKQGYGGEMSSLAADVKNSRCKIPGINEAFRDFDPSIDGGGHFRGLSTSEFARELLELGGVNTRRMSKRQLVDKALSHRSGGGEQTISDFAVVLENVMNKVLLGRYAQAPDTWREVCGVDSVNDFRPANRYRMGAFGPLDLKPEGAEYTHKVIPDGAKFQISTQTYGNKISISREAIINDDMGAILDQIAQFGRAAGLTLEVAFYALLAQNAGLGPSVSFNSNTAPLFDASWGNVGAGAALSMASVEADNVLMQKQKDLNGNEYLDLFPAVLLVPVGLRATANQINNAKYDPTAGSALEAPNYSQGLYRKVVATPRLTGTRRYSFADPSVVAAFKCVFLDGEQTPMMAEKINWDVDGQEMKLRLDAKMQAHDPKGALTNAGA